MKLLFSAYKEHPRLPCLFLWNLAPKSHPHSPRTDARTGSGGAQLLLMHTLQLSLWSENTIHRRNEKTHYFHYGATKPEAQWADAICTGSYTRTFATRRVATTTGSALEPSPLPQGQTGTLHHYPTGIVYRKGFSLFYVCVGCFSNRQSYFVTSSGCRFCKMCARFARNRGKTQ